MMNGAACTATCTYGVGDSAFLTAADIEKALVTIEAALKPVDEAYWERVRQQMVAQGLDPAEGWVMVLPDSMMGVTSNEPSWVRFSLFAQAPTFINAREMGLTLR